MDLSYGQSAKPWKEDLTPQKVSCIGNAQTFMVTNEVVFEEMKVKRELLNIIRARQWSFVWHLLRENDGMERHIIETEMVSKRGKGRQRTRMFDWITTRLNMHNAKDLGHIARGRVKKGDHDS